jgi:UDP-glucose 4-epimerase
MEKERTVTRPMKIGVTGGAGFVGSHLCERLLAERREVIAVDNMSMGNRTNMESFAEHPSFRFHDMDCTDAEALRGAFDGCDAIAHLAAEKIPRYGGALHTLQGNAAGAHAACEVGLELGALVVITSTSDVYGNAASPFREDGEVVLGPSTTRRWAYAVSKLFDEHIALAMADESGLRTSILRLFNVYGPRNHPSWWGGPITAFAETLLDGGIVDLHGDGHQTRTFTYVTDTVDGIVRALDTPQAEGEILNIGAAGPITIIALAEAVQASLGIVGPLRAKRLPYEALGGNYQDVRHRVPDTSKVARILGFEAKVGLDEGLAKSVAWHVERRADTSAQVLAAGVQAA